MRGGGRAPLGTEMPPGSRRDKNTAAALWFFVLFSIFLAAPAFLLQLSGWIYSHTCVGNFWHAFSHVLTYTTVLQAMQTCNCDCMYVCLSVGNQCIQIGLDERVGGKNPIAHVCMRLGVLWHFSSLFCVPSKSRRSRESIFYGSNRGKVLPPDQQTHLFN